MTSEHGQAVKIATSMGLQVVDSYLEDLAIGQSTAELSIGAHADTWTACDMTWTSSSIALRQKLKVIGFGKNCYWTHITITKRIA